MRIHDLYAFLGRRFRRRRMARFARQLDVGSTTRVLDIGGTPFNWTLLPVRPRLTFCNLRPPDGGSTADWVIADARALPFARGSFDVSFSNSVIEHLGSLESQRGFAREIQRVGDRYYVQTPNRRFPIEPHYLTPFVHWLPKRLQLRLLRFGTVWGWLTRPSAAECRASVEEIRLLDRRELKGLFPKARIEKEPFFGLAKSWIARAPR